MTELTRYNAVPRIIGADMNVEYEADPNGQLVFADSAVTLVAELRAEVERLKWRPITETDLPKIGDEVLGEERYIPNPYHPSIDVVTDWHMRNIRSCDDWHRRRDTHFRPINPPLDRK